MESPKVSVIIPTYNQANYLAEAVQSVLDQTYAEFEIVVVNDASTDHTDDVMSQFYDPRVKYIVHEENRYAAAARNTGIRASSGDLLAFLDSDDKYHPEKLQVQVKFLDENPDIGLTYNHRIIIDESGNFLSIETIPNEVALSDLVLLNSFAPSEIVMRKEWAIQTGLFDESFVFSAEDPDFHMRLALKGCQMAGVQRVLNYRRRHVGRVFRNLANVIDDQFRAYENTFANPSCPPDVLALREKSLAKLCMILSYFAFAQNETALGQDITRKAIRFDRTILDVEASKYLRFLINMSIGDGGGDHEALLRQVFAQLPPELEWIAQYADSAIATGHLIRATWEIIWERVTQGDEHLEKVASSEFKLKEDLLKFLTSMLLNYEAEFGLDATQTVLKNLTASFIRVGNRGEIRKLKGNFSINRAFRDYRDQRYAKVPFNVFRAMTNVPNYLTNRGVMAIFVRSLAEAMRTRSIKAKI